MGKVRAKFYVATVAKHAYGGREVILRAVTKHGPNDPADNEMFWRATPNGELKLTLGSGEGDAAYEHFEARLNKNVYLDMIDEADEYHGCNQSFISGIPIHEPGCPEHATPKVIINGVEHVLDSPAVDYETVVALAATGRDTADLHTVTFHRAYDDRSGTLTPRSGYVRAVDGTVFNAAVTDGA